MIDYKSMEELDIHSITIVATKLGRKEGCLMVSVEQGILDNNNCRSTIKHAFEARDIKAAAIEIWTRTHAAHELFKEKL